MLRIAVVSAAKTSHRFQSRTSKFRLHRYPSLAAAGNVTSIQVTTRSLILAPSKGGMLLAGFVLLHGQQTCRLELL